MGLSAIKFRKDDDALAALLIVNEGDELMLVTNRGIIIRQRVNDISIQSRPATGVRLQKLDDDDAIAAVALVPPALQDDEEDEEGSEMDTDDSSPAEATAEGSGETDAAASEEE